MKTFNLKALVLACTATALVGCGDSETNITEIDPTVVPVVDDHHDEELGKGRLAIADAEQAVVHIFDLEDNSLVDSLTIENPATALHASPENRYAVAIQKETGKVQFIDGGLWQEAHGDHYDQHVDAPELTSFSMQGAKPAHFVSRGEQVALFFDGNDVGENAELNILSDESIKAEKIIAHHDFDTYMHGTAEIRGEYVLSTLRVSDAEGTLPNEVAVFEIHGDHLHQEQVFDTKCPDLHGSFQNENYIAFACDDGILTVQQEGSTFTDSKIAYPADVPESKRIWTIKGSEHSATLLGLTPRGIFVIDPVNQGISLLERPADENSYFPRYTFDAHHEHLLLLDKNGALNAYSAEHNWELEKTIPVLEALADDVRPLIIASKAHELVYIINGKEVTTVDLHEGEVVGHFDLDFAPGKAAWLGIASEEEHVH
ncbi:hypothetical protein CXF85_05585 [Colwellia sp. 75C3]|uniref:hypothetical protein n=1 Tax=Colwellia sp. 75C3 TaxID=888425 RepID=UPI000C323D71|nr:hypothetical protein [Colwellia sp. 75C3]PKG85078.1 hypothetical protein CXF85_05585 [Colwellia sp. 75C3]